MRAVRAARVLVLIQPIRTLFSGVVIAVAVAVVLAKALYFSKGGDAKGTSDLLLCNSFLTSNLSKSFVRKLSVSAKKKSTD